MRTVRFLFNDDMARAIVQGRKTVTRWPVLDASSGSPPTGARFREYHRSVPAACFTVPYYMPGTHWCARFPCAPGDLLIGRECFAYIDPEHGGGFAYRADYDPPGNGDYGLPRKRGTTKEWYDGRWSPSIHMPDAAAESSA